MNVDGACVQWLLPYCKYLIENGWLWIHVFLIWVLLGQFVLKTFTNLFDLQVYSVCRLLNVFLVSNLHLTFTQTITTLFFVREVFTFGTSLQNIFCELHTSYMCFKIILTWRNLFYMLNAGRIWMVNQVFQSSSWQNYSLLPKCEKTAAVAYNIDSS